MPNLHELEVKLLRRFQGRLADVPAVHVFSSVARKPLSTDLAVGVLLGWLDGVPLNLEHLRAR